MLIAHHLRITGVPAQRLQDGNDYPCESGPGWQVGAFPCQAPESGPATLPVSPCPCCHFILSMQPAACSCVCLISDLAENRPQASAADKAFLPQIPFFPASIEHGLFFLAQQSLHQYRCGWVDGRLPALRLTDLANFAIAVLLGHLPSLLGVIIPGIVAQTSLFRGFNQPGCKSLFIISAIANSHSGKFGKANDNSRKWILTAKARQRPMKQMATIQSGG